MILSNEDLPPFRERKAESSSPVKNQRIKESRGKGDKGKNEKKKRKERFEDESVRREGDPPKHLMGFG